MKTRLFKKADLFIALAVLLIGAAALIFISLSQGGGRTAVVEYRGETVRVIDLDGVKEGYTFTVSGDLEVVIEVSPQGIRFLSSPCPDKRCVEFGLLNKKGQVAVCMPAGVSVRITGEGEYDGVTG
ncbi:MAG: NusG domain II-containing protein [Clostridia bacterium]|nr:NusG domain II-containing protein [Clostridia bacterium]